MREKIAGATLAAALLVCGPAWGSSVSVVYGPDFGCGPVPLYTLFSAGGEINRLTLASVDEDPGGEIESGLGLWNPCSAPTITSVSKLVIDDGSADIGPIPTTCSRPRPRTVLCDPMRVVAQLGGGDDAIVLSGGAHRVSVDAGTGDDTIRTANAGPDDVTCGPGLDTVLADAVDTVAADCEAVTRLL